MPVVTPSSARRPAAQNNCREDVMIPQMRYLKLIAVLPLVWSEEQSLSGFFISGAPSE